MLTRPCVSSASLSSLRRAATLALAGCAVVTFAQSPASTDPIPPEPTSWQPLSTTSQMTGSIRTAPGNLTLVGHAIPLGSPQILSGKPLSNAATLFSTKLVPGSAAALYKVAIPASFRLHENNTLCDKQPTTWLLLLRTPSGLDKGLNLAAFSGSARPDLSPAAVNNSTALCSTFGYVPAGS